MSLPGLIAKLFATYGPASKIKGSVIPVDGTTITVDGNGNLHAGTTSGGSVNAIPPITGGGALPGNVNVGIQAASQGAAGSMSAADKLKLDNLSATLLNKNFIYSGMPGQPTWVWGTNDGINFYVYNPSNFQGGASPAPPSTGSAPTPTTAPGVGQWTRVDAVLSPGGVFTPSIVSLQLPPGGLWAYILYVGPGLTPWGFLPFDGGVAAGGSYIINLSVSPQMEVPTADAHAVCWRIA